MGEVIGLGKARKARDRAEDKRRAEENRIRFGRTRAEREATDKEEARAARLLDGHRRDED
jgi:hypothetical protein